MLLLAFVDSSGVSYASYDCNSKLYIRSPAHCRPPCRSILFPVVALLMSGRLEWNENFPFFFGSSRRVFPLLCATRLYIIYYMYRSDVTVHKCTSFLFKWNLYFIMVAHITVKIYSHGYRLTLPLVF